MQIAVLTFEGFNELDSFVVAGILNRLKTVGWTASITCPSPTVTSMNGVTVEAQQPLEFANVADVVLFGSGIHTRSIANNNSGLLSQLSLDPKRQLIGAQCSGTLLLAKLGVIGSLPACTDLTTKPWVLEAGVRVLEQPFFASGNIATAGGCLSSQYLAAWVLVKLAGVESARSALHYVAPVGEKEAYVSRVMSVVEPFVQQIPVEPNFAFNGSVAL